MAQDLKDTIKEKIDLLDFLTTKGITWQNQGSIPKALCVFHEEKTPSFTLSKDRKRYKCYGCNESGSICISTYCSIYVCLFLLVYIFYCHNLYFNLHAD